MVLAVSSGRRRRPLSPQFQLAFAIRNVEKPAQYLLLRVGVPYFSESEPLAQFEDSQLWDLPTVSLSRAKISDRTEGSELVRSIELVVEELGEGAFHVVAAVKEIEAILPLKLQFCGSLKLFKEPDFGPGAPTYTVIILSEAHHSCESASDCMKWFEAESASNLLLKEEATAERIGVLAANFFYSLFPEGVCCGLNIENQYQEYPPGMLVIPMDSRTLKPFSKTNLAVWAPKIALNEPSFAAAEITGDAIIVDPGCSVPAHDQLAAIVRQLPRKLIVFLTHHHPDHVDGIPAVKQENSEAVFIAHDFTIQKIRKAVDGSKYIAVNGNCKLLVGGQGFQVVAAPGHTHGHLALFHSSTRTLVAGDHCVGEGSSVIDANSGGNLHDYLKTSHEFLELHPKVIVPMHGRPNIWPINLLKGYIKHRQAREAKILKAIEDGATSAFDIVCNAYKQTHTSLWPAALMNVRCHVEHLHRQGKLPVEFSMQKFERSRGWSFLVRWIVHVIKSTVSPIALLCCFVIFYCCYRIFS